MDVIRVAAASVNQTPLDWEGNAKRITKAMREARKRGVKLICFPELSLSGYGCEDMFLSLHTARQAELSLQAILAETFDMVAVVGLPVYFHGNMYNCVAVMQNGSLLGLNPKKSLAREGVHYESRWFSAWPSKKRDQHNFCGQNVPLGDLTYSFGSLSVGIEICEEAWGFESGAAPAASEGIELVLNASASHFSLGKYKTREILVADASRAMQVHYVYANLMGLESGQILYDGGNLFAEAGKITARGERFSFRDYDLLACDLDLDQVRVSKLQHRSIDMRTSTYPGNLRIKAFPVSKESIDRVKERASERLGSMPTGHMAVYEEFLHAQIVGLMDYLRKSGSRGFVLSLSGGCDSSTVAVLVAHAIAKALKDLGSEELANRLKIQQLSKESDPRVWINQLFTVVYQATRYSGLVTKKAAESLAAEIGAQFHYADVDELVSSYVSLGEKALGRSFNWEEDDLSLQNIQARARSPLVWLIANIKGALLLSTSNRSEASVGYATMDGDTSGGLAPLAGVDKPFLRDWLVWAQNECSIGLGPIRSLEHVNEQEPTAELRPVGKDGHSQKDEDDLMPYAILNEIEACFVKNRMDPQAIVLKLIGQFPQYTPGDHQKFLDRFLRLWRQNQWKRERFAPSFHIADYSLNPRTWCRYPIFSGPSKLKK